MIFKLFKFDDGVLVLEELDNNSSSVLKSHKTVYANFIDYWMNLINEKSSIVEFYLDKNDLHIKIMNFGNAFFDDERLTISIDDGLLSDLIFRKSLESLIDSFKEVKYETRENIKFRQKDYYKEEKMAESVRLLLNHFNQNKALPDIDDDFMIIIYHYIRQHENDLGKIEKAGNNWSKKSRFIVNMIMLFAVSSIGLYSFICSLGFMGIILFGITLSTSFIIKRIIYKNDKYFKKTIIKSFIAECRHKYFDVFKNQNKSLCVDAEIVTNEIFDFINSDFLYMRHRTDIDYRDLMEEILTLRKRFSDSINVEDNDAFSLMRELVELELTIFSRKDEGFPKNRKDIVINREMFDRRLAYLGYDEIDDGNPVMDSIYKVIGRIESFPYEGCELEILKLLRIAIEEVVCGKSSSNPQKIFIKIDKIEEEVTKNINDNYEYDDRINSIDETQVEKKFLL